LKLNRFLITGNTKEHEGSQFLRVLD